MTVTDRTQIALPMGYQIHWYEIRAVVGQGGFGITYLAKDANLDHLVAIKEYLPTNLAVRSGESTVRPASEGRSSVFDWGLERFVREARTLAKFKHPNIVTVFSVFEANGTAYMVMEYERGVNLEQAIDAGLALGEAQLLGIVHPLLDGLALVHAGGFIHRDIKPENVLLRKDGSPVLLDFGSARESLSGDSPTLTTLVTPGYAPFEQYDTSTVGEKKQGPWTDIYSLGATLYRAVTGSGPPDAMGRVNAVMSGTDILKPASEAASGDYSPEFLAAIDWALEFLPENRPQSVDQWRVVLAGRATRPAPTVVPNVTTDFARAAPTEVRTQIADPTSTGDSAAPGTSGRRSGTDSGNSGAPPSSRKSAGASLTPKGDGTAGLVATDRIAPPALPRGNGDPVRKHRAGTSLSRRIAEVATVALIFAAMGAWYFLTQPSHRPRPQKVVAAVDDTLSTEKVPSAELLAASRITEQKAAAEDQARIDEQRARERDEQAVKFLGGGTHDNLIPRSSSNLCIASSRFES